MTQARSPSFAAALLALAVAVSGCEDRDLSNNDAQLTELVSPDVVISQLYGGGGSSGAPFTNDYVELFNRGASAVSITGWSVQYASANGSSWARANLSGTIPAGGYYLVQLASNGSVGSSLPAPDATGPMNMSGSSGTVALVTNQTQLSCGAGTACLPNSAIRDFVGYGSATQFEGAAAPTLSVTTAGRRATGGCTDTDNNRADFAAASPGPRNSASAHTACGGGGGGGTDAGVPDAAPPPSGDGTPTRVACTGSFGSAMTATFGRLDGFLVSIVNVNGSSTCRGDNNHLHLQVRVNGRVEDIAVNLQSTDGTNVAFRTASAPLADGAWSEGWHPGQRFDYVNNLGVRSTSFTSLTLTQLQSQLDSLLANANHVSIFATGFDGTGGHNIHRNPTNHDGAIVINPTTSNPQYLIFHFANQTF
jgi:hypothetical protein